METQIKVFFGSFGHTTNSMLKAFAPIEFSMEEAISKANEFLVDPSIEVISVSHQHSDHQISILVHYRKAS